MSRVPKNLTEHKLRQRAKSMLDAGHTDDADLDTEAADRIPTLERELEEARALNNTYAWERDKAREERDATERRSEAFWKPRLTSAEAKVARMGEALKPFSVAAGGVFTRNFNASDVLFRKPATASHAESVITAGHLFAARSALQSEEDRKGQP